MQAVIVKMVKMMNCHVMIGESAGDCVLLVSVLFSTLQRYGTY